MTDAEQNNNVTEDDLDDLLSCALSHERMTDPVFAPDGRTYERATIVRWLRSAQGRGLSPFTRLPIGEHQLIPNRAIATYLAERDAATGATAAAAAAALAAARGGAADGSGVAAQQQPNAAAAAAAPRLTLRALGVDDSVMFSLATTTTTTTTDDDDAGAARRVPVDVCCLIDVSYSMSARVTVPQEHNAPAHTSAYTQLDIVKHAALTIAESLGDDDRMAIVAFSDAGEVRIEWTPMTHDGKQRVKNVIGSLREIGGTNLWEGIRVALDLFASEPPHLKTQNARVRNVFLLTDGLPTDTPRLGHAETMKRWMRARANDGNEFHCVLNTFGFGNAVKSDVLRELAAACGNGTFAFIPDAGMVGTIFVNALANSMTTVATDVRVSVYAQTVDSDATTNQAVHTVDLGSVRMQQSRDFALAKRALFDADATGARRDVYCTISYYAPGTRTPTVEGACVRVEAPAAADRALFDRFLPTLARQCFVECVTAAYTAEHAAQQSGFARRPADAATQRFSDAQTRLCALRANRAIATDTNVPFVNALLADLVGSGGGESGQVQLALLNREYFDTWGKHFLPSIVAAHAGQYCNNFKDFGVQFYGGAVFKTLREKLDELFCSLPPPKPSAPAASGGGGRVVASMASFHSASAGCFHGDTYVATVDGDVRRVRDVAVGAHLRTPDGGARVLRVVKIANPEQNSTAGAGVANLVTLPDNGVRISPFHPVSLDRGATWRFPADIAAPCATRCDGVYQFVLDIGHVITVFGEKSPAAPGVQAVTWGHAFAGDLREHAFFGNASAVAAALDALTIGDDGVYHVKSEWFARCERLGTVAGIVARDA